jgi:hypothetical protein
MWILFILVSLIRPRVGITTVSAWATTMAWRRCGWELQGICILVRSW